jgi:hypothetical protein
MAETIFEHLKETAADKVLIYMAANKLVANPKKTKFLLMRGKHHKKCPETRGWNDHFYFDLRSYRRSLLKN